jgi:hypothetical protein
MAEITPGSKLTEDQKKKVMEWAKTRAQGGSGVCSFCGTNAWSLVQEMLEISVFRGGKLLVGGNVVPAFMLVCNTCGHLEMVSAVQAGLMESPKPSEPEKPIAAQKEEPSGK